MDNCGIQPLISDCNHEPLASCATREHSVPYCTALSHCVPCCTNKTERNCCYCPIILCLQCVGNVSKPLDRVLVGFSQAMFSWQEVAWLEERTHLTFQFMISRRTSVHRGLFLHDVQTKVKAQHKALGVFKPRVPARTNLHNILYQSLIQSDSRLQKVIPCMRTRLQHLSS